MPAITGTVRCLQISETAGFTTIEETGGTTETFILWFGTTIPPALTSFSRVVQSMWVSVLREAHANGLTVSVTHPTGSAAVTNVQLGSL
jgi:hypothetical protein